MSDVQLTNPFEDITAEGLENAAESKFGPLNSPGTTEPPEPEGLDTPSVQEPTPEPDTFQVGDRQFTRAEVEAWANFDNLLRSDPRLGELIWNHLRGDTSPPSSTAAPVGSQTGTPPPSAPGWGQVSASPTPAPGLPGPTPGPSPIPENVDLSDPTTKFLYDQFITQQRLIENQRQELARLGTITSSRVAADNETIVNDATTAFKTQYSLDDAQMARLRQVAGRLEVVPSVLRGINPITGTTCDPNPYNAVTIALEAAAWLDPEIRQSVLSSEQQLAKADAARKAKLQSIGGSARTSPRTPPQVNLADRSSWQPAAVAEVAAAMFGNTQE